MSQSPSDERSDVIVSTLLEAFEPLMESDPQGFRTKFRRMARDPFAFYRGTACLFYADVGGGGGYADFDRDWVHQDASRIWIQGDLHAENFGTYLDADGRLVFDVNDFDEAYLGHYTWDLARFCASLALLCWQKALPDEVIEDLVRRYVRAYADQIEHYQRVPDDTEWALTLDTAEGAVLDALHRAKLSTRFGMLESMTVVEDYRRRFADSSGVRRLEDDEADAVEGRLRRLPGHPARLPPRHCHVRRSRCGRTLGLRRGQRWTAGVQHPDRGVQPGAGQRRRAVDEAGEPRHAQQSGARRACRLVLRAPRAPDRHLAARPAGARRPVPGLGHPAGAGRSRRVRRQRGLAVRGRRRLGRACPSPTTSRSS